METNSNVKQAPKKKKRINLYYDFVKITGAPSALLWLRHKTVHSKSSTLTMKQKAKGGVLISSNHVSFTDPVLLHCVFWRRRLDCLAIKNLYNTKMKNWFFTQMHCIPVDKENFSLDSFHAVIDSLKSDRAVVIFPEGQINRDNSNLLSFKSGAVLMAHTANKPILPIYIVKRKKWYQRSVVLVGDPVDIRALCGEHPTMQELQRASDYLHEKEEELIAEYFNFSSKNQEEPALHS